MSNQPSDIWGRLEQVDEMNTRAMPKWRDALQRVFSGKEDLSTAQKAEILGVPGRRQFLRVGGTAIAGAALIAACGNDDDGVVATTSSTAPAGGVASMDVVLANTAISLEVLAVNAYDVAIGSGLVTTQSVGDAAALFKSHHEQHRDALVAAVGTLGGDAYTDPNPVLQEAVVDPAVAAAGSEADIIALALELEQAAAQTYTFAAGALSTPALRQTIMTIGGIENRHQAILATVSGADAFANGGGFIPSTNPLPEDAVITS